MPILTPAALTGRNAQRLMLVAASILLFSHLIHLSADPSISLGPFGIRNWSSDYYTDEGWAASGAVRAVLQNQWYSPGDFNLAVNAPMWSLLLYLPFKLFGVSIVVARAVAASFYIATAALVFFFVKSAEGRFLASCVTLLLACNFFAFNFSRLAMSESAWLFFLVLSLFVAQSAFWEKRLLSAFAAGLFLSAAILVKLTASFGAAPLLAVLFLYRKSMKDFVLRAVSSLVGASLLLLPYKFMLLSKYPVDEALYRDINISQRAIVSVHELIRHFIAVIYFGRNVDVGIFLCVLLGIASCLIFYKQMRFSPVTIVAFTWLLANIAVCCTVVYTPPRYFLSFTVPMMILAVCLASELYKRKRNVGLVMAVVLIVSCIWNVGETAAFQAKPSYDYQHLGDVVRQAAKTNGTDQSLMMGGFANTLSIFSDVPSLNDELGSTPRAVRIKQFHPNFYVSNGPMHPDAAAEFRQAGANIQPGANYNVMHNYISSQPIYIYPIQW